jgi:hypothetical protein
MERVGQWSGLLEDASGIVFFVFARWVCADRRIRSAYDKYSVSSVRNRTTPLSRSHAHSATFQLRPRPDASGNSFFRDHALLYSHAPPKTAKNQNATYKNLINKYLNKKQESLERAPAPLCQREQGLVPPGFFSPNLTLSLAHSFTGPPKSPTKYGTPLALG